MTKPPNLPDDPEAEAILNGERALDLIEELCLVMRETKLGDWPPSRIEDFRRQLAVVIAIVGPSE